MTGIVERPMPVAEKVVPAGRSRIARSHATSAAVVPGHPAGHAHHQIDVHVATGRQAVAVRAAAAAW